MNVLTNDTRSKGPTDKLCPSEEPKEAMAPWGGIGRNSTYRSCQNAACFAYALDVSCMEVALQRSREPVEEVPAFLTELEALVRRHAALLFIVEQRQSCREIEEY